MEKDTFLENQIVRSSLDFPAIVYNLSNFIGTLSWSANVNLHAFFHYYLITFWLLFIWFQGKYSAKFVSILLYCRKGIRDAIGLWGGFMLSWGRQFQRYSRWLLSAVEFRTFWLDHVVSVPYFSSYSLTRFFDVPEN